MTHDNEASSRTDPIPLSKGNDRVKQARKLARRASRAEQRLFLAEGRNAVTEALGVPGCVVEVFATVAATEAYAELRERAPRWTLVADDALASLADAVTPQGLVAVCRPVDRPLDHLVGADPRLVAVCADVRDPGNAGTVLRTADAAGADSMVLTGSSVDAYNPKTVRASAGSLFHLPLAVEPDPTAAVALLQARGLTVLAADGSGETDLFEADDLLTGPTAWLFGNEAWGLPPELAELADHRVRIPILGAAESLNIATAAAVCLYASARAQAR
jgi:RNA methyltransferase, TrmH family